MTRKKAVLNRAVFTRRAFDSRALTVLATLIHHFQEVGDCDLFVQRGGQVVFRTHVHVVAEDAPRQIDVDLAALPQAETGCGCEGAAGYTLAAGGVMTFHAAEGIGQYVVKITRRSGREKHVVLDSSEVIPAGDLFAVTLVRPGTYEVRGPRSSGRIHVSLPKKDEGYRPDQPVLVELTKRGTFKPRAVRILAGQTVVFLCTIPAQISVEMARPDKSTEKPTDRPRRYTLRRPSARKSGTDEQAGQ